MGEDEKYYEEDLNYEEDLAIDPHQLDEEWLKQPSLYMQYAHQSALSQKIRDKAKERLEVVRAQLDKKIRKDPGKYEVIKVTETTVANAILEQKEYQEAKQDFDELSYDANILQSAVRAFEQRKKALEGLVTLWVGNYFSGPKEPRILDQGKRILQKHSKVAEDQRTRLNRRRK